MRVPVALTAEQRAEHDDLTPGIARLVARATKRPLTQPEFLQLMQLLTSQRMICNGLALSRFTELFTELAGRTASDALLATLASPKLAELRELVRNLAVAQGRKVVIFSQWRRMLELAHWAVRDLLAEAGQRSVFFSGGESQDQRTRNVEAFHEDQSTRVFFATDAGGVGLNLQRAASTLINLELPWNPAVLEQRIGRIHRHGQKRPIEVYNLVSEEGIESRIAQLVEEKRAVFNGLFDGTTDEVKPGAAGSFLARIERLIEPAPAASTTTAPNPADEEAAEDEPEPSAAAAPPPALALPPSALPPAALPPAALPPVAPPAEDGLAGLLAQVTVRPSGPSRVTIEAPVEVARQLSAMMAAMAQLLAKVAEDPEA